VRNVRTVDNDRLEFMESIVAMVIVLNCIAIGIESEENLADWKGWEYLEYVFIALFSLEAIIKIRFTSLKEYFLGNDWIWNLFDFSIILVAVVSIVLQHFKDDIASRDLTTLRLLRLTRLVRAVRIFRLSRMKELRLMIKGLFSGWLTLTWALLLLFVFDYILGLCMVTIVAITPRRSDGFDSEVRPLFRSLEMSMMTIYRCFTGDCATSDGSPLIMRLLDEYGSIFVIPWILCMMVVTFGLFNLISAIYIEQCLTAAKHQDE